MSAFEHRASRDLRREEERRIDALDAPQDLPGDLPEGAAEGFAFAAALRAAEALLFAAAAPLTEADLAAKLPGADIPAILAHLRSLYSGRGVELTAVAGGWRLQTAPDLAGLFAETREEPRRLPRAAMETLAVIAYHQPVTRAEIEEIRGVSLSRGSLDLLLELEWVKPRGRRRSPGRPLTFGTTETFLSVFGLASLDALPGKDDLKAVGLVDPRLGPEFDVPRPDGAPAADEDPLDAGEADPDFFIDHLADQEGRRE